MKGFHNAFLEDTHVIMGVSFSLLRPTSIQRDSQPSKDFDKSWMCLVSIVFLI